MEKNTEHKLDTSQKLIWRLERRATLVLVLWPLMSALGGGFAGYKLSEGSLAAVGAIAGGYLGYLIGSLCSLRYQFQVQTLLWQKRVEELLQDR